jgi:hypothetical protein
LGSGFGHAGSTWNFGASAACAVPNNKTLAQAMSHFVIAFPPISCFTPAL